LNVEKFLDTIGTGSPSTSPAPAAVYGPCAASTVQCCCTADTTASLPPINRHSPCACTAAAAATASWVRHDAALAAQPAGSLHSQLNACTVTCVTTPIATHSFCTCTAASSVRQGLLYNSSIMRRHEFRFSGAFWLLAVVLRGYAARCQAGKRPANPHTHACYTYAVMPFTTHLCCTAECDGIKVPLLQQCRLLCAAVGARQAHRCEVCWHTHRYSTSSCQGIHEARHNRRLNQSSCKEQREQKRCCVLISSLSRVNFAFILGWPMPCEMVTGPTCHAVSQTGHKHSGVFKVVYATRLREMCAKVMTPGASIGQDVHPGRVRWRGVTCYMRHRAQYVCSCCLAC
jgi:hypothetical protein